MATSSSTRPTRASPDRGGRLDPRIKGFPPVVLHAHFRELVAELEGREPQVRADQPDAVHKMRVATRRLRSALTTFKPMLSRDTADSLRGELRWLAAVLGVARDAEVMRDRLAGLASDEPSELGGDVISLELGDRMQRRYDAGLAHVREVLDSARYLRLRESLDSFAQSPPWSKKAHAKALKVLRERVRREWQRLDALARDDKRAEDAVDRDANLHEIRKSAKRLRYACEALAPLFGSPATRLAKAAEELQATLGDHQDSVVSQQLLRELARHTTLAGDDALIYGRLHLLEQMHAERALAQYRSALKQVRARRPKRWHKV